MRYSKILATGSYLPKKILTNSELEKMVDTTDEWIFERTGIRERHIADENDTPATMGIIAAQRAMEAANITPQSIGMVIAATSTQEFIFPSTACVIQAALDIPPCPAFDLVVACAGFNYALGIADQYIRSGAVDNVLIIGAEVMSRIVDWTDRRTCILFADGAGAVVLGPSTSPGIISTHLHADGKYKDLLYAKNIYSHNQLTDKPFVFMKGNEVFRLAINMLGDTVTEALAANDLKKEDIDWLIPHQANLRIIQALAKKLDMPMEKVVLTLDKHGNTSAASIPIALDVAVRDGRVKRGDTLLLESFGGGFAWGSAVIKY